MQLENYTVGQSNQFFFLGGGGGGGVREGKSQKGTHSGP